MDAPWKVILAFVGVFIAGAVFGGVFTLRASARRAPPVTQERPLAQLPPATQNRPQVAGPQAAGPQANPVAAAQARANPITPVLMRQFTQKLSLSGEQKEALRKIVGRAGEDYQRLRQENLADTTRVTERMYADVAAILTPEQKVELEQMRKQMLERAQAEKKRRADAAAAEAASRANAAAERPTSGRGL